MSALAPAVHSVHFYESHSVLIDRLCGIVSSGLRVGNSILIVATSEHRVQLVSDLREMGVDVREAARDGRFMMFDARGTLDTFMVNGLPDRDLFYQNVGHLLLEAKKKAVSKDQGLTVYGEMVAVLWDEGNKEGALALERLWNEALNERAFHLHCAYPRWIFNEDAEMSAICDTHSHVLAA